MVRNLYKIISMFSKLIKTSFYFLIFLTVTSSYAISSKSYKCDKRGNIIGDPEIISRGFIFEKINKDLLDEAARRLKRQVEKKVNVKKSVIYGVTMDYLGKFFFQKTGRRPMILPVIVEV